MHTSEWRVEPGNLATWTKVLRGGLTADDGLEIVAKTYAIEGYTATDVANLIAAAPELLEACELLLIYLGDWNDMEDETCAAARRAIAKARGQEVPNG